MKQVAFSTSIKREKDALNISNLLKTYFMLKSAQFDFGNKVYTLKLEGKTIVPQKIERTLAFLGFKCQEIR